MPKTDHLPIHLLDTGAAKLKWANDCQKHHNRVLKGDKRHYCYDNNWKPIDETCVGIALCECWTRAPEDDPDAGFHEEADTTKGRPS